MIYKPGEQTYPNYSEVKERYQQNKSKNKTGVDSYKLADAGYTIKYVLSEFYKHVPEEKQSIVVECFRCLQLVHIFEDEDDTTADPYEFHKRSLHCCEYNDQYTDETKLWNGVKVFGFNPSAGNENMQRYEARSMCVICLNNEVEIYQDPCGHALLCMSCFGKNTCDEEVRGCITCRQPICEGKRIYLP